jgi:hypothetical protein
VRTLTPLLSLAPLPSRKLASLSYPPSPLCPAHPAIIPSLHFKSSHSYLHFFAVFDESGYFLLYATMLGIKGMVILLILRVDIS